MCDFTSWMIVFIKDKKRLANYHKIDKKINCNLFNAIDSINNFEKYSKIALKYNYTTTAYINENKKLKGKIGCNLSHQMLLEHILKNSKTEWNLILEDDVYINIFNRNKINNILKKADKNNSKYIQLYTNKLFLKKQKNQVKISDNLYKMAKQCHTTAYFINKKGIEILINSYPIVKNIDYQFNFLIDNLNSLCWINNIFINMGSKNKYDTKCYFGSIIWENPG